MEEVRSAMAESEWPASKPFTASYGRIIVNDEMMRIYEEHLGMC